MGKVKQLSIDLKRYNELNLKFNPTGASFVEVDKETTSDPEWAEFNVLCIKLAPYFKLTSNLN